MAERILQRRKQESFFTKEGLLERQHQLALDLMVQLKTQAERLAPHFPSINEVKFAKKIKSAAFSKEMSDKKRYGDTDLPKRDGSGAIAYGFEVFKDSSPDSEDNLVVYTRHPRNSMKDYKIGFDQWGRLVGQGMRDISDSESQVIKWVPDFLMNDKEIEQTISFWHLSKGEISELMGHLTAEFFSMGSKGYARKYHGRSALPVHLAGVPEMQFVVDGTLPNRLWERIKSPAVPLLAHKPEDFGHHQEDREFIEPIKWRNRRIKKLQEKYGDRVIYFVVVEDPDNLLNKLDWGPVLLGDLFKSEKELSVWDGDDYDRNKMRHRAEKLVKGPFNHKPFVY